MGKTAANNVATLTKKGDAPFFIICDHASNRIPEAFNCLGLPEDMLQTHIAWDIGAGDVTEALTGKIKGWLFRCEFSRLIIDPNRALDAPDLIPATSDQLPIPGNQMISEAERARRIADYHDAYHRQLAEALDAFSNAHKDPLVISIHSFTNRLMGAREDRPWRIGVLWREDEPSARAMLGFLGHKTGLMIGDNEPYDARVFNYTIDRHVSPRGLSHLTLELRQDTISAPKDAEASATLIAEGIVNLTRRPQ